MSLESRMDNRTPEEFAAQLAAAHQEEAVIAEAFRRQIEHIYDTPCTFQDTGVDNTGSVIQGDLSTNDVDVMYSWGPHQQRVEIKTAPVYLQDYFTFKVSSLEACVKHNSILLLYSKAIPDSYFIIRPHACQRLVDDFPHHIYAGFSPNDPAVRVTCFDYKKYLEGPKKWCDIAMDVLQPKEPTMEHDLGLTFGGQVTRVIDGDTVEVEVRRTVRIRLLDCWAPETRTRDAEEKREGLAAKDFLTGLIQDKDVTVHVPLSAQGKFGDSMSMGRVLGQVYLDGKDVSALVVEAGHATKEKQNG